MPGQAYGYEECDDGSLKKQDPPDRDVSIGPAFYKPAVVSVFFDILNSNKMSFIGYVNKTVINFLMYFTSQMCIVWQIMDIIPQWFHVFIQNQGILTLKSLFCFFYIFIFVQIILTIYELPEKYSKLPINQACFMYMYCIFVSGGNKNN